MNDEQQPISPRARLQQLLAIPDRQRTDAEWDELNELEIMLASGNREGARDEGARRNGAPPGSKPGGGRPHGKKQSRKFHKRAPKGNAP